MLYLGLGYRGGGEGRGGGGGDRGKPSYADSWILKKKDYIKSAKHPW